MGLFKPLTGGGGSFSVSDLTEQDLKNLAAALGTGSADLYSMITGAAALDKSSAADGDLLPVGDVSANKEKKMLLSELAAFVAGKIEIPEADDFSINELTAEELSWLGNALGVESGGAKVQTGSYPGTNTYGATNPCILTFNFAPKLVIITRSDEKFNANTIILVGGSGCYYGGSNNSSGYVTWSGNSVSWYTDTTTSGAVNQNNYKDATYAWVAIG